MTDTESIEILYRDDRVVVVDKPAGVMVHRSRISGRRERFLLQILRDRIGCRVYPVHRLDRPTSGALLFGLDPETARHLAARFARREIEKTYVAVVRGFVEEQGVVDLPLRADVYRKSRNGVAKAARTIFFRAARTEVAHPVGPYATARYSMLRVTPETGRVHQIRRHLRDIAHPVIGDRRYGDSRHNRFFTEVIGCNRLLLASVELGFEHPATGERLVVSAPLGPRFSAVLERFGWSERLPAQWRRADPGSMAPKGRTATSETDRTI